LQAAGYGVDFAHGASCCGRPAFSLGRLDLAAEFARENVRKLSRSDTPLVFLEPSCYSMIKEDYAELGVAGADELADRAVLFESFMDELLEREPGALRFKEQSSQVAIHNHCHAKATVGESVSQRLANRVPGVAARILQTGCCGMAGAFGMLDDKYDLSVKVAQPLLDLLRALPENTDVVASGTSCRQQIEHLHGGHPLHMAEWLEAHLLAVEEQR
jgi:Fe-S oxidoreductase